MPYSHEHNPVHMYEKDPRKFILDIIDLVTGQTTTTGGNDGKQFTTSLLHTLASRKYVDRALAIETLTEYQQKLLAESAHIPSPDWRIQPLSSVIESLTHPISKQ